MNLDIERGLISSIIVSGTIQPALDARVTAEFFGAEEHQRAWRYISEHYASYGKVPSVKALKRELPNYTVVRPAEPLDYYLNEVRDQRKHSLITVGMLSAADSMKADEVDKAIASLQTSIQQAALEVSVLKDTNLVETWQRRLQEYEERMKQDHKLRGIPTGFHTLDYNLLGMQPEQLWTIIGLPKSGKSTLLLRIAINAHESGASPLFIGFEMSNEEQESRYDAMVAGINHLDLLSGRLSPENFAKVSKALARRKSMHPFHLSHDMTSALTLTGIAGKIEQYKPSLVVVDGAYMMDDENGQDKGTPQALTNITRGFKRLAQHYKIPILISTQALYSKYTKSKGLDANAVGYSSSFVQDSDVVIGAESTEEDDSIKLLRIIEARNAARKAFNVHWDWDSGEFSEHELDDEGAVVAVHEQVAAAIGYDEDGLDEVDEPEETAPRPRRRRRR